MNAGLENLAKQNNRKQIKKYLLQQPITQQYNVSISNSTKHARNYFSAMYENVKGSLIRNKTERWRVNFNTTSSVFNWLDFSAGINVHYSNADYSGPTLSEINSLSPYEMIVNEDGSYATQLMKNRKQLEKIGEGVLPYDDWSYNILREARAEYSFTGKLGGKILSRGKFRHEVSVRTESLGSRSVGLGGQLFCPEHGEHLRFLRSDKQRGKRTIHTPRGYLSLLIG